MTLRSRLQVALLVLLCLAGWWGWRCVAPRPLLRVAFIDVGQGDAELLETRAGHTLLIDTGPRAARHALLEYLRARGVRRLDFLVATHPHVDHIANVESVMARCSVGEYIESGEPGGWEPGVPRETVAHGMAGTTLPLDAGVAMQFLEPHEPLLSGTRSDPNNNSIVLRVVAGRTALLFAADEEEEERARLESGGYDLRASIYKAAHHGSANGTDDTLLALVQPRDVVISCGAGNRYGHPHAAALAAMERAGARVWRTDLQGTIVVDVDEAGYHIHASR